MTAYLRPDDGVATEAEMVEVRPGQFVNRFVAQQLGLAIDGLGRRQVEIRAMPKPARASEVVGGFEGDCGATQCGDNPPRVGPGQQPTVDAKQPGSARPRRSAGQQTRLEERDGQREGMPAEVLPPPATPGRRAKRSLREISADHGS